MFMTMSSLNTFRLLSKRWSLIPAALAMICITQASEYEVDGTVTQSLARGWESATASFTVYVKDCGWLIATVETNQHGRVTRREIGSTNAGEIYEYIFPTESTPQRRGAPARATILPSNIPVAPL